MVPSLRRRGTSVQPALGARCRGRELLRRPGEGADRRRIYPNDEVARLDVFAKQLLRDGWDDALHGGAANVPAEWRNRWQAGEYHGQRQGAACPLDRVSRRLHAQRPNASWESDYAHVSTCLGMVSVRADDLPVCRRALFGRSPSAW